MAEQKAYNVIAGAHGVLRIDNVEVAEVTNIDLTISIEREEIQWGLGTDSKITKVTGEGTITVDQVRTSFASQFSALKEGKDKRFTLVVRNADPDALGGQMETIIINEAWLNVFKFGFKRGSKNERDYDIGFNPMGTGLEDIIK